MGLLDRGIAEGGKAVGLQATGCYNATTDYDVQHSVPGDVLFAIRDQGVFHAGLVSPDDCYKIDSAPSQYGDGVRRLSLLLDRNKTIVFRFNDAQVAANAAQLAASWAPQGASVGYSGFKILGQLPARTIHAGFGSCNFGKGAQARLLKYRSRTDLAPANVTCAEMVLLAYQLSMREDDPGFLNLDAKHTTPATLFKTIQASNDWTLVGRRPQT